jgi:hypothetical protein
MGGDKGIREAWEPRRNSCRLMILSETAASAGTTASQNGSAIDSQNPWDRKAAFRPVVGNGPVVAGVPARRFGMLGLKSEPDGRTARR